MATNVYLPALGMAQETGVIVRWLKAEGEAVKKGEALFEVETDKATVEVEASANGYLTNVTAAAGDEIPVGQVIAVIVAAGEILPKSTMAPPAKTAASSNGNTAVAAASSLVSSPQNDPAVQAPQALDTPAIAATPLASRMAAEHNLDLGMIKPAGRRIQKADVLTYIRNREEAAPDVARVSSRLLRASPKARQLAREQQKDLAAIQGSGPDGAILAADVLNAPEQMGRTEGIGRAEGADRAEASSAPMSDEVGAARARGFVGAELASALVTPSALSKPETGAHELAVSHTWRIMAERITQSWTSVPHFYLVREVQATRLMAWREQALKRSGEKVTYTDLLVKAVAAALRQHPRLNASWNAGKITLNEEINVGLAVAIGSDGGDGEDGEDGRGGSEQASREGLVVPVIHQADRLDLSEIARHRQELVRRAQAGKLRPEDIDGGTFTISNLGMYGVDAFNAIINPPQVAILAVGRIAERVVPVNGQPAVVPMMMLTLSCDHRVVDGARGAQFLSLLAEMLEEPLVLLG